MGRQAAQLVWISAQLAVILLLARAFHIESPAFYNVVLPLAFGGFLIHHWLPRPHQPIFFAVLSIAGVFLVFGAVPGAWLIGVGLVLIGLCHLPIAFWWRVSCLAVLGGVLAAMRAAWMPAPWPGAIWPVLGSMFMFRLAMYLYDLKHRGPASPGFVLSYFFLLPNSVFLMFPVIDFQTFRRTHFDRPAVEVYGEGIQWMFRGLVHLVLYRVIYQYFALSPGEVISTAEIVQYLVANYGLYLRVSGQFHMIVGLLHLFGFRLPETHRFFYLASSFSDLWRRINIYWKDFMQKMVYLPVIFSLKRRSETTALIAATSAVVVVTWLLHSYQWFWLLGTWLISETDIAFWGVIGLLLIANTLREQRRGRSRQLTAQAPAPGALWRHALQTTAMFALMTIMWGIWTSPTFEDFRVMLLGVTWSGRDAAAVFGTLAVVAVAAFISRRYSLGAPSALVRRPRWQHPLVVGALPLGLFWLLGEPLMAGRVPGELQAVAQDARVVELNEYDAERMQRGYYEQIVGVNRFNGELWSVYARAQQEPAVAPVDAVDPPVVDDEAGNRILVASTSTIFKGGLFSVNRWGFRDRDYRKLPPRATVRIAMLGPSYALGSGVDNGEPFEQLVEDRLNRELRPRTGQRYEILNFALPGASLAEQAIIVQSDRISQFKPGVALVVGHAASHGLNDLHIASRVFRGKPVPEPVAQWVREAGIEPAMSEAEMRRRLLPRRQDLLDWSLRTIAREIQDMGARPVFALVPMPFDHVDDPGRPVVLTAAHAAGFAIIDIQDVFVRHDQAALALTASDRHPNAAGHRIIADRLYGELLKRADVISQEKRSR